MSPILDLGCGAGVVSAGRWIGWWPGRGRVAAGCWYCGARRGRASRRCWSSWWRVRRDAGSGPQRDALGTAFGLSVGGAPDRFLVGLTVLSLLAAVAEEQFEPPGSPMSSAISTPAVERLALGPREQTLLHYILKVRQENAWPGKANIGTLAEIAGQLQAIAEPSRALDALQVAA